MQIDSNTSATPTSPSQPENVDQKIQNSLRYSIIDGTFYCIMVGFGESLFSAFAVFLKATNLQLGLLAALPQLLGSILQLFASKLVAIFHSRQKFVCTGAFLQGLMYLPIALTFFLGAFRTSYLVLFITLYSIFGMIIGPVWNSWMGDLVDERLRGQYFARRNRILSAATFVAVLASGYLLQTFHHGPQKQYLGFLTLFLSAFLARTISTAYLWKKYEPPYQSVPTADTSFWNFLKKLQFNNYTIFTLFLCSLNFSVAMSSPFFAPYMLNDLRLDYVSYTMISAIAIITKLLVLPRWGRACDQFGTRKILALSSILIAIIPTLWLVSGSFPYLLVIQVFAGLAWAGFELASFNFMFETTRPQERLTYVAYYNVMNGVAMFIGGLCSSWLIRHNHLFQSSYFIVFLLSGIMRCLTVCIFIPRLKEIRTVEQISYSKLLLKIVAAAPAPTMGLIHSLITLYKKNGKTQRIEKEKS